jgi:hypothetical protein
VVEITLGAARPHKANSMATNNGRKFVNNAQDEVAKSIAENANSAFRMAGLAQQPDVRQL